MNQMNKIRIGIIGVGHLGKLHASIISEIEEAELIGVYDTDQSKAERVSTELKIPAFHDREELMKAVDAINIVTPTSFHHETALSALKFNCDLFIEKPISKTEKEAEEIISLAREKNRIIQVGHIERFNPALLALSDVELKPLFIESHRLAPFNPRGTDVAVILDLMIHDLDLILTLVKSQPIQIDASGVSVVSNSVDIANARIKFENGCVANVTASRISTKKMRKMRIFQPNSYISMDFVDGYSEIYSTVGDLKPMYQDGTLAISLGQIDAGEEKKEIKYTKLQRTGINPLKYELNTFIDSISARITPVVTGEDGLAALKLANHVLKKIEEHTIIVTERASN
jgi:predicted dehydrogenase